MIVGGWVGKEEKKKKKKNNGRRRLAAVPGVICVRACVCMCVCVDAAQPLLYEPKHTC